MHRTVQYCTVHVLIYWGYVSGLVHRHDSVYSLTDRPPDLSIDSDHAVVPDVVDMVLRLVHEVAVMLSR